MSDFAENLSLLGAPLFCLDAATGKRARVKGRYAAPSGWPDTDPGSSDDAIQAMEPGDALGMVCGHAYDVLDVDPRHGGSLAALRDAGLVPQVRQVVRTPSGGWHLYVSPLGAENHKPLPGVDLQGAGRFVLVPPTEGYEVVPRDSWPDLGEPVPTEQVRARLAQDGSTSSEDEHGGSPANGADPSPQEREKAEAVLVKAAREVAAAEGARNDTVNAALFLLYGFVKYGALERDVVDDTVWEAVQQAPGAEPYTDEEFAATQRSAWRKATAKKPDVDDAASAFGSAPASGRALVDVSNASRALEWLRTEVGRGALSGLFLRGGSIAHTPRVGEDGYLPPSDERDDGGPAQVRSVSALALASYVDACYAVYRTTKKDGPTDALFPQEAANRAAATVDQLPNLRVLETVTHTPAVRPDGTILNEPGYDAAARLLYLPEPGLDVPPVADCPTRKEVRQAGALLLEMVADFPFVTPHHRANYLGALLTPPLRPLFPPPYRLVAFNAPQRGSGKTLLADTLRWVHGGVFRAEFPGDSAEMRKWITSTLDTTSAPVVVADNVRGVLRSSVLEGLLTSRDWSDRQLGATKNLSLRNDRLWVVTGNNISIGGDLARRTLWVTIDANTPQPERRTGFAIADLQGWVQERRGDLIWALLTLIRAWVVAGKPVAPAPTSDGYGRWLQALNGILAHAALGDGVGVVDHQDSAREQADEDEDEWAAFLAAVHAVHGSGWWQAKDIVGMAGLAEGIPEEALPSDIAEKLHKPSGATRSLGRRLLNHDGTWAGRLVARRGKEARGGLLWKVEEA